MNLLLDVHVLRWALVDDPQLSESQRARLQPLDITIEHTLAVGALPDHHTDPFDRLLVAQARTERFTLVTRVLQYEVDTLRREGSDPRRTVEREDEPDEVSPPRQLRREAAKTMPDNVSINPASDRNSVLVWAPRSR